jgi:hypothetical protein
VTYISTTPDRLCVHTPAAIPLIGINRMRSNQRKREFIDSRVQGALVLQVLRQWVLFFLATFVLLLGIEYMFGEPGWSIRDHISALWERCGLVYLAILVMLPAFLRDTVKLSHRFVGPVVRVRNELIRLADGQQVKPVQLRKRDYWHDLADAMNRVLERIEVVSDEEPAPTPPWAGAKEKKEKSTERPAELVRS